MNRKGMSSALKAAVVIIVIVVAAVAGFAALTYPREVVNLPVNFSIGATSEQRAFDVPFLHDVVQVKVMVNSGAALWTASITDSDGNTVWSHQAAQGEQNTYTSLWQPLASGSYNFTFATIGAGSLEAQITVTAKGGFW